MADHLVDEELSVGDFVLAGGELAALVVVEAVARLLPGVLGNDQSARDESFADRPARVSPLHPTGGVPGLERPRGTPVSGTMPGSTGGGGRRPSSAPCGAVPT